MITEEGYLANAIRFAMDASRVHDWPDPSGYTGQMRNVGRELGHEVAKVMKCDNLVAFSMKFSGFWAENGLGQMTIMPGEPIAIKMSNCYDCTEQKINLRQTRCTFKLIFLKTVYEDVMDRQVVVKETECCKSMARNCRFTVTPNLTR